MTHPEDDDHDIADHGTVIMDRKAASGIPRPRSGASGSRPAPPAIMPAAGMPATPSAAQAAAPSGLPVLPPSLSGVAPAHAAHASSAGKRMAILVAFGSFTVVFVLGALIMLMMRLARDANDDGGRASTPAQTKPAATSRK